MSECKIKVLKEYLDYHTKDDVYKKLLPANKDVLRCIEAMLEENKQSKERITYLENSNNRREETIINLRHEQQLDKYKEVIDEVREDIVFCINGMKNEFACTDSRTNRELHTMVKILEDRLQILDKAKNK